MNTENTDQATSWNPVFSEYLMNIKNKTAEINTKLLEEASEDNKALFAFTSDLLAKVANDEISLKDAGHATRFSDKLLKLWSKRLKEQVKQFKIKQ